MYRLNIIQNGQVVKKYTIKQGKPVKLTAQADTSYQLLDETGMVLHDSPNMHILGSDWVLMDKGEPILILENYGQYAPVSDPNLLMQNNVSLMTTSTAGTPLVATNIDMGTPLVASNIATEMPLLAAETGFPLGAKLAGGLLLVGGIAAAAGGGGGGGSDNQSSSNDTPKNRTPELTLGKDTVSVKENIQGATITTVKATDADGDQISYSVNDSRFEVVSGSLKLKSSQFLDYEKAKTVSVTVTAKDEQGASVSKTVKINVQDDASDNINRPPELTLGKDTVSIKENIQGATITTVKATDVDGDKISYSVNDSRFEVVSGSLKLKSGKSLDYDKEKTVSVTVTAKDEQGASVSKTVKINVQDDISDNPSEGYAKIEIIEVKIPDRVNGNLSSAYTIRGKATDYGLDVKKHTELQNVEITLSKQDGTTQVFKTQLDSNLYFSIDIPMKFLMSQADGDYTIVATLNPQSIHAVQDSTNIPVAHPANPKSVSATPHSSMKETTYDDLPYFIQALSQEWVHMKKTPGRYAYGKELSKELKELTGDEPSFLAKNPFGQEEKTVIKYHFLSQTEIYNPHLSGSSMGLTESTQKEVWGWNLRAPSSADKNTVIKALAEISQYANVEFKEASIKDADFTYLWIDQNLGGEAGRTMSNWYELDDLIEPINPRAIMINKYKLPNNIFETSDYITALHETLHALGGKHPHESPQLSAAEDHRQLTALSYEYNPNQAEKLGMFDLAYLHYRFGVNPNQRTGNDVYQFKKYNKNVVDGDIYIWDGAGNDTFDASAATRDAYINLTPGSWCYTGSKTSHFALDDSFNPTTGQAFIGYGTMIENAIGSDYKDTLIGNDSDNILYGNRGNDTLEGGAGNDYLDGGLGEDILKGGKGNDVYIVDDAKDQVIEIMNNGADTVYSSVTFSLPENVENIILTGTKKINATGNAHNNYLEGNNQDNVLNGGGGSDKLCGGGGSDTLTGGTGKDIFMFDLATDCDAYAHDVDTITDFNAKEDRLQLTSSNGITSDNWQKYLLYDAGSGDLSYTSTGKAADAITFVHLSSGLDLTYNHFVIA
ncbi:MAG: cadherin domain-containing protein [Neisseriaceae bacterium]|nr:cadherin domain-containing protein [Neisseriaceae bacterium]